MMARQADGQMSIKEDAEGDIDAAAYTAEYADADADEQMSRRTDEKNGKIPILILL